MILTIYQLEIKNAVAEMVKVDKSKFHMKLVKIREEG